MSSSAEHGSNDNDDPHNNNSTGVLPNISLSESSGRKSADSLPTTRHEIACSVRETSHSSHDIHDGDDDEDDTVVDENDIESSSDEDDEDSVLSGPKWRDYWPKDSNRSEHAQRRQSRRRNETTTSLQLKWLKYQRMFLKRERLLNRIVAGKSQSFIRQLRERELLVQHETLQVLLRQVTESGENQEREETTYNELQRAIAVANSGAASLRKDRPEAFWRRCLEKWQEYLVFEINSLVPSVIALLVHTIALISIYEGLNMSIILFKRHIIMSYGHRMERRWLDLLFVGLTLVFGIFLLRCTGDLYWWLSDPDFDLVKFDFHNRRRLGFWDARILATVRVRSTIRAVLFLVGYHYCYTSLSAFLFWPERYFDQSKDILAHLPSALFAATNGYCWSGNDESACTRSCQDEMARQEQEFLMQKKADLEYTASVLSTESYDTYWYQWTHQGEADLYLFRKYHHVAYIFCSVMISIFILAAYGFKFWGKY